MTTNILEKHKVLNTFNFNFIEWLQQYKEINGKKYGNVAKVHTTFPSRKKCGLVHPENIDINGFENIPAASVIANRNGPYYDYDFGEVLIYSGQGGEENFTDQQLTKWNKSLTINKKKK